MPSVRPRISWLPLADLSHTPSCIRWVFSGSLRASAMISPSTSSTTLRVLENGALNTATPRSAASAEVDLVGPDAEAPHRQQVLARLQHPRRDRGVGADPEQGHARQDVAQLVLAQRARARVDLEARASERLGRDRVDVLQQNYLHSTNLGLLGEDPTMGKLDGKIAIVTGAGQGIGRGIAEKLAAEGATVAVTDVNEATAKETAEAIGGVGIACRRHVARGVAAMVAEVRRRFGRIDVLVNNAGWDKVGPFVDSDPADWDRVIAINLYGVLHTCKAVLPIMAGQGGGTVVNLASDAGRVGSSGEAVYAAAKGGIIAFTKTIAREMARSGINANAVCPGPTDTPLFASIGGDNPKLREALIRAIPMRRLAQPTDLANVVAFLASDEAAYVTGQTVSVSGGLTMS